ncbi:DUF4266 domain-containing protein [Marinobacter algicola]|uniref:DUF4266 domain-containing protein n=1 Tax=Marinobacter algicola DG893 TaxID=443152 RepID=A6F066_9GAMM|nr:DUF4266 domain-containing protein [Marinobacter algicola]EDM47798.1 hypothetical protein MDG893_05309 [Marinobacter algicola DG893]
MNPFKAVMASAIVILMTAGATGCSDIKPWVKPYERDKLADPVMSLSRHGKADSYMHHVYQARESARGSEGGSGGGCGCN